MKRVVFSLVLAIFCFWSALVVAQTVKVFKKQRGTLGHIAVGCGHSVTDWRRLRSFNPDLPFPVEIKPGIYDVRIHEGDSVFVPDDWDCSKLNPVLGVVTSPPLPQEKTASLPESITAGGGPRTEFARSLWFLSTIPSWFWFLLAGGLLLFLIFWLLRDRRRNPARYPSVIPGGLSGDLEVATRQIEIAYPGRQYRRIERGHVIRDHGPERILVQRMTFGDGVSRSVYVNSGNEVYRGTLSNGTEEYYLCACGNLGAEFVLPQGWRFVASASHDIPQPDVVLEKPVEKSAQTEQIPEKPTPIEQLAIPVETPTLAVPAVSQNHQESVSAKIRIFDENGKIMMEMEGISLPSIEIERGPRGTRVSRRG